MSELLVIGQMISIVVAAVGTPGVTFWVMKKMNAQAMESIRNNCVVCRKDLDGKIDNLDEDLFEVCKRQKDLRERILPDEFVKRRELEALEKKCDKEVDIVHKRIEKYHPVAG